MTRSGGLRARLPRVARQAAALALLGCLLAVPAGAVPDGTSDDFARGNLFLDSSERMLFGESAPSGMGYDAALVKLGGATDSRRIDLGANDFIATAVRHGGRVYLGSSSFDDLGRPRVPQILALGPTNTTLEPSFNGTGRAPLGNDPAFLEKLASDGTDVWGWAVRPNSSGADDLILYEIDPATGAATARSTDVGTGGRTILDLHVRSDWSAFAAGSKPGPSPGDPPVGFIRAYNPPSSGGGVRLEFGTAGELATTSPVQQATADPVSMSDAKLFALSAQFGSGGGVLHRRNASDGAVPGSGPSVTTIPTNRFVDYLGAYLGSAYYAGFVPGGGAQTNPFVSHVNGTTLAPGPFVTYPANGGILDVRFRGGVGYASGYAFNPNNVSDFLDIQFNPTNNEALAPPGIYDLTGAGPLTLPVQNGSPGGNGQAPVDGQPANGVQDGDGPLADLTSVFTPGVPVRLVGNRLTISLFNSTAERIVFVVRVTATGLNITRSPAPSASARPRFRLPTRRVSVQPGKRATVRVPLTRAARTHIRREHARRLRVKIKVTARDARGDTKTFSRTATVKVKQRRGGGRR